MMLSDSLITLYINQCIMDTLIISVKKKIQ